MIQQHPSLNDISDEVRAVLAALAHALDGHPLTPERVADAAIRCQNALPNHSVTIDHQPRSPKGSKPRVRATYILRIRGPRIDGQWAFSSGQLTDLLKAC
jgi:hypothetical protein